MKKHWTQTKEGRRKMALIQLNRWAQKKQYREDKDSRINGFSIRKKLADAQTIEELNEVKSFLDLKDELMGRLP